MADVNVSVGFQANDIDLMKKQIDALRKKKVSIKIAATGISTIERDINSIVSKKYKLDIDTSEAEQKIKNIYQNLGGGKNGGNGVKFDTTSAERTMSNLQSKIEALQNRSAKMKLAGFDTSAFDAAVSSLSDLGSSWSTAKQSADTAKDAYNAVKDAIATCSAEAQKFSSQQSLKKEFTSVETTISSLTTKIQSMSKLDISNNYTKQFDDKLKTITESYKSLISDIDSNQLSETDSQAQIRLNNVIDSLETLSTEITEAKASMSNIDTNIKFDNIKGQLKDLINNFNFVGPKADDLRKKMFDLWDALNNGSDKATLASVTAQVKALALEVENFGRITTLDKISSVFSNFFGSVTNGIKTLAVGKLTSGVTQAIQEIYNNVYKINSSLTQLQVVTSETDSGMAVFFEKATAAAQEFGASVSDMLDSIQVFSRLGYNLEDSLNLSNYATVLSNTAAVTVDEATTGLTAIIKGYDLEVSDAEHVSDVLIDVGQKYAISASELMDAFENGGAALDASGTTFEESAALLAAANAAIQDSSKIGTAMKTVSARIRGSSTELEEMGDSAEDCATGISKYRDEIMALTNINGSGGVDIMADAIAGEYKSIYDIFVSLSEVWGQLSDATQSRIAEILGGKQQFSVISSIIGNISDATGAYDVAMNADGVAEKANEIYLESAEGKIKQLNAVWETFSADFMSSDIIVGGAKALTGVVDVLDKLVSTVGSTPTILAALNFAGLLKNLSAVKKGISGFISSITTEVTGISKSEHLGISIADGVNASGLSNLSIGIGAVTTALSVGLAAWNTYQNYVEEMNQAADEASQNFEETATSIDDYKSQIENLKESLTSGNLTQQEEYDIKTQLLRIQDEIVEKYGAEAAALNILTASADDYCKSLDNITKAEAYDNIRENKKAYEKAEKEMTKDRTIGVNLDSVFDNNEIMNVIRSAASQYDNISLLENGVSSFFNVGGDAEEVKAALTGLYNSLSEIDVGDSILDGLMTALSKDISGMDNIVGEYADRYESYLTQKLATDDTAGAAYEQINSYKEAIEEAYASKNWDELSLNIGLLKNMDLSGIDNDSLRNYLQGVIDEYNTEEYETTAKLSVDFEEGSDQRQKVQEYLKAFTDDEGSIDMSALLDMDNGNFVGASAEDISAFSHLNLVASEYGMTVTELVAALQELGIVQGFSADAINSATIALNSMYETYTAGADKLAIMSDILEAMSSGGITQSEALGWIQEIPELAKYYDAATNSFSNIENVLAGLIETDVSSFIEEVNTQIENNTDLSDDDRAALRALATAYADLANSTLSSNKAATLLNKGITSSMKPFKQLQTQIGNLWNSDVFADARDDLIALAEDTGITAGDITDLANDNIYLAAMLDETGVSASYLAEIFNNLSTNGTSALESITDDAIRVNEALSAMEAPLNKAETAYEKYQAAISGADYNNAFSNYQEAYESLGEMFENGEYGKHYQETVAYLMGEGLGATDITDIYKQYQQLGKIFSEADNGLGFLETLYNAQSEFDWDYVKLDSSGSYIWDIKPEDFNGIAEGLGMTEEAVAACVEALGMFGDFAEYDVEDLVETFRDLNMTLTDTEGNAVLSEDAVRSMLETLGKSSWEIDQIIAKLEASGEIKFLDSSNVEDVQRLLEILQGGNIDGTVTNVDNLVAALKSIGMKNESIAEFMKTMEELGYTFTSVTGNILSLDEAVESIDGTSLEHLYEDAEKAMNAFEEMTYIDLNFDFETDSVEELEESMEKVSKLKDAITKDDGQTPLDGMEEQVSELNTMLYALENQKNALEQPFIMSVDTSGFEGDIYDLIADLQTLYSLTEQKSVLIDIGADTSGVQAQIDSTIASIQATSPEVLAAIDLDPTSESSIYAKIGQIQSMAALEQLLLDAGVDQTDVDAFLGTSHDTKGTVLYYVNHSIVDSYKAPTKSGTINYTVYAYYNGQSLSGYNFNKTATITYKTRVSGAGGVNGTAHASGSWGLKKPENALVGELGQELVVDPNTGTWYTVGDTGAQFSYLPQGAIVFNHKQTESLFKYGRVAGRGRAYASGTVKKKNPATGTAYKSSYTSSTTSSKSSSSNSSSNYMSGSSDTAEEAEEEIRLLDWIEILIDRIERRISNLSTTAESAFKTLKERTSAVADEMSNISHEIDYQQEAYVAYLSAAEEIDLAENYKELVRNGAIALEYIQDDDLNEKISDYQELYEKALDARDAVVELDENLRELYQDQFDLVSTEFDNILDGIEARRSLLEEYVDQIEESGHIVSEKYYNLLISNERESLKQLMEEKNSLAEQLNNALNFGAVEKYSEAWYEMQSQIDETQQSIAETLSSITELNNSIRQLRWDRFDDAREVIEQLNEEAEFYIDVLSRGDKLFDDRGGFTDKGDATVGLHVQQYKTYLEQVSAYGDEITDIEKELSKDKYNTDLIERKQELVEAQRESAQAALDEKDAIVDLVEEGIEIQLDALQELIDKYKDSLDSAKNAYDYQKKIKEQTKEIASLEKQLNAYRGDMSEEARSTVQQLKVDLEEARSDLEDTQYDQYVSDQKALLDDLYDNYEEILNARLDDIDGLILELTEATNVNSSAIRDTIKESANSLGIELSSSMDSIWKNNSYSTQLSGMYDIGVNIQNVLQNIENDILNRYDRSSVDGIIAQMKQNSTDWYLETSDAEREGLHNQNVALEEQLSAITGKSVYSSNGSWYDSDGNLLYSVDKGSTMRSIISKMQKNSAAWAEASASQQQELSDENIRLGQSLASLTGNAVSRGSNGVWYMNGHSLYDMDSNIETIVSQMKENASAWFGASDKDKAVLSDKNLVLGNKLAKYTGLNIYRGDDGVWYIDDEKLFDVYHSGGIVGGGNLTDQERLSVLLNDEAVLTNSQLEVASDNISALSNIVTQLSDFKLPNPTEYVNGTISSIGMLASGGNTTTTNNNSFDITFSLPNVKSYDEFMNAMTSDTKFEKYLQAVTVDRMAGKSRSSKDKYKWGS